MLFSVLRVISLCALLSLSTAVFGNNTFSETELIGPPTITLNGVNPTVIEVGGSYTELGAAINDPDGDVNPADLMIQGTPNTNLVGTYYVTYSIQDAAGNITNEIREVQVVDTTPPTITLTGGPNLTIEAGTTYTDPGATAYDTYTGNLTSEIVVVNPVTTNIPNTFTITYNVSDRYGNAANQVTRTVQVVDTTAPLLTLLNNSSPLVVAYGGTFTDPGYTVSDNSNTPVNVTTNGSVNTSITGSYTITYTATDASSNSSTRTRTVYVGPQAIAGTDRTACVGEALYLGSTSADLSLDYQWTSIPAVGQTDGPTIDNAGSAYTRVVPQVTTQFTLTVTSQEGVVARDQVIITVVENPNATVISDTSICYGESISIGAPAVTGNTYQWTSNPPGFSSTLANPSVTPLQNTTYFLTETITASNCSTTNPVTITVVPNAEIYAGPDESICESEVSVGYRLDQATSTIPDPDISLLWEAVGGDGSFTATNELNPRYYPGTNDIQNGSVTLRLTGTANGVCSNLPVSSEMVLTLVPALTAEAGLSPVEICQNTSYTLSGTAANYTSITWSSSGTAGTLTNANTLTPTYSPSAADVANGVVTLTMRATPIDPCSNVITDSVDIQLTSIPEVFAGANKVICSGENVDLSDATWANGSSFSWTSSNGGDFISSGPNPNDVIYVPNNADISAGGTVLTLTVSGENSCGSATELSSTSITIHQAATVFAGPENQILCEGSNTITGALVSFEDTIQWSSVGGDGTWVAENSITPIYTPGPADLSSGQVILKITATSFNGCSPPVEDQVVFQVNQSPVAYAGPNDAVCAGSPYTLSGATATGFSSITWSTSGSGSFNMPSTPNPIYTPTASDLTAGFVILTMTLDQNGCTSSVDEMELSIVPRPTAIAGADINICQGETTLITSASATGYSSILWEIVSGSGSISNATSLNPSYVPNPNETGEVKLRLFANPLTDGRVNCGAPAIDNLTIFITASPTVSAGPNQTICEGDSYSFIGSGSIAANYNQIVWSSTGDGFFSDATSIEPTYTPGTADRTRGQVTLRAQALPNAPCTLPSISEMILTITKKPVVDAGPPSLDYCEDDTVVPLDQSAVQFADTYVWDTSGSGTFTPSANSLHPDYVPSASDIARGSVIITLTGSQDPTNCGAESSDAITINFIPLPQATAGPDAEICDNNSYTLSGASATNYSSVTWTTSGTGTFSNNTIENPTYFPSPNDIALGTPIELTIAAVGIGPCEEVSLDSMILTLAPSPQMEIGAFRLVCEDTNLTINLTEGVDVINVDPSTYRWTTTGTGYFTPDNSLSTVYVPSPSDIDGGLLIGITLTAQPLAPCLIPIQDSFNISIVKNPTADAGPQEITICDTGHTFGDADATNYQSLQWTNLTGSGTILNNTSLNASYIPSPADISAGTVTLRLTANPNAPCGTIAQDDVVINIQRSPEAYAGDNAIICEGDTFVVSTATAAHNSSVSWFSPGGGTFANGSTLTPTFTPSSSEIANGQATLVLTAQPNSPCSVPVSDTMTLTIQNQPNVDAGNDTTICAGDTFQTNTATATFTSNTTWSTSGTGSFLNDQQINTTYTPSQADINAGFVVLTLEGTAVAPCVNPLSSTLTLTIAPQATVEIIPNSATICSTDSYSFTSDQIVDTNVTRYLWTSSGDGTFSDINEEAPTYTPGSGDIVNGSVRLTLSVEASNACVNPTDIDSLDLTIDPVPTIDVSPSDTTVCYGSQLNINTVITDYASISWQILSGGGTIVSGGNSQNPVYEPASDSQTVRLRVTATSISPCTLSVSEEMIVEVTALPEITSFSANSESCSTDPYTISNVTTNGKEASVLWSTTGTGTFNNAASINPIYTPTLSDVSAGFVDLTMTAIADAPCVATDNVSQTFRLTLTKAPRVNAGADDTVCFDSNYVITDATASDYSSLVWTSNGTGTWQNQNSLTATYIPSTTDLQNGFFELTLTGLGFGSCDPVTDTKRVDVIDIPVVDLPSSEDHCTNESSITLSPLTLANYDSLQWRTSSSSGTFSSTSTATTVYYPTAEDFTNGQVTITLIANPIAPCLVPVEDTILLSFVQAPEVNAGVDITVCEDQNVTLNATADFYTSLLWTSSGTGVFLNGIDDTLTPTYIPSSNDILNGSVTLTLTATGNPTCTPSEDNTIVSFAKNPVVLLGNDLTYCENQQVTFSDVSVENVSSMLWQTNGGGILFNENTPSPTYTPALNETGVVEFYLTVQAENPCTVPQTFTKSLTYVAAPEVNAGPDITACQADGNITIDGATASAGATIIWNIVIGNGTLSNTSSLTPTYSPTTQDYINGEVRLSVRALGTNGCANAQDEIIMTMIPSPVVDAGADTSICNTESYTTSNASVLYSNDFSWSTPDGVGTFVHNPNDLTAVYTPAASEVGTIRLVLTATSDGGCAEIVVDQVLLTINPPATVNAGADQLLCVNDVVQLGGTVSNSIINTWSTNGAGSFVPSNTSLDAQYVPSPSDYAAGSVTLTLTADGLSGCDPNSDSVNIQFAPAPVVFAGADAEICAGESYDLSDATISNGQNIQWVIVAGDGTFGNPNSLNATYNPGTQDLVDGVVTLRLTADGIDPCLSSVSDEMVLTIRPQPQLSTQPSFSICEGSFSVTGTTATNYDTIQWRIIQGTGILEYPNQLAPVYTTGSGDVANGTVILRAEISGQSSCSGITKQADVVLTVNPSGEVSAGSNMMSCAGAAHTFANGAQTSNVENLRWTHDGMGAITAGQGTTTPTYTPASGELGIITFTLTAGELGPCSGSVSDTVTLEIVGKPVANAGTSFTTCAGSFDLNGSVTNASTYAWSGGNGSFSPNNSSSLTPTYTPTPQEIDQGFVSLILTANPIMPCDTASSSLVTVYFEDNIVINAGPNSADICAGESYDLSAATVTNFASFQWSTSGSGTFNPSENSVNPTYEPSATDIANGTVTLTLNATGNNNCQSASDDLILNIEPLPQINIPDSSLFFCDDVSSVMLSGVTGSSFNPTSLRWITSGSGYFVDNSVLNPEYVPQGNDLVNGVTLTIQVNGVGFSPCSNMLVTDSVALVFTPAPEVFAGANAEICSTESFTLTDASASTSTSIAWSTSGTGTFSNTNALHPIYTPSPLDIANGSVVLTLEGTSGTSCSPVQDQMTLTITKNPVVTLAQNIFNICSNETEVAITGVTIQNAASIIWSHNGQGSFKVSNTALNQVYVPQGNDIDTGVTLTLTAYGNGPCTSPIVKQIELNFAKEVLVDAGADQAAICASEQFQITNASVVNAQRYEWTTLGGDGVFTETTTNINPIYMPGPNDLSSGTVTLRLSAIGLGNCSSAFDEITLTINPNVDVYAGANVTLCASEVSYVNPDAFALNEQAVRWSRIDGSIAGFSNPEVVNPEYFFTQEDKDAGYVTLVLRGFGSASCSNTVEDSMTITFVPEVELFAGNDAHVCYGSSYVVQDATVNANSFDSIRWTTNGSGVLTNANTLRPEYTPSLGDLATTNRQVTLTMTVTPKSVCGAVPVSDALVLTLDQNITGTGTILGSASTCEGETYMYQLSGLNGVSDYSWVVPAGAQILSGQGTNQITVSYDTYSQNTTAQLIAVASNECLNAVTTVLDVSISAKPELTLASGATNVSLCYNEPLTPILYNIRGGTNDISIEWFLNGVSTSPPGGIIMTENTTSVEISGTPTVVTNSDLVYTYDITASTLGCPNTVIRSGQITLLTTPKISLDLGSNSNQQICERQAISDISYTLTDADDYTLTWIGSQPFGFVANHNTTTNKLVISGSATSVSQTTTYTYEIVAKNTSTNCIGEVVTGRITVNADSTLTLTTTNDTQMICEGESIQSIEYAVGGGATNVNLTGTAAAWMNVTISNGIVTLSGTPNANITSATDYSYTLETTGSGCQEAQRTGVITVIPNPSITLSPLSVGGASQTVCEGTAIDRIRLDLIDAGASPIVNLTNLPTGISYSLVGSTLEIFGSPINITTSSVFNYGVEVQSRSNGCSGTFSGSIQVNAQDELILETPGSNFNSYCSGESIDTILYRFAGGTSGATIQWSVNGTPIAGSPQGVNTFITANQVSISGALVADVTSITSYSFVITSSNSGLCTSTSVSGELTLNPMPKVMLNSGSGLANQQVCENVPIDDIVYQVSNGANSVRLDWDNIPNGIISQFDATTGMFTISGSVQNLNFDTTFNYTVIAENQSTGCTSTPRTGSIRVAADHDLNLLSGSASTSQQICEGTPLPIPILYEIGGGATSARVLGLNNTGLNWLVNGNQIVISGTPSLDITTDQVLNYTVETIGNSCNKASLTGFILLKPNTVMRLSSPLATSNQTICEGEPIQDIEYEISEGYWRYTVSGLPNGVTHSYDPVTKVVRITGTPSANISSDQTYTYAIKAINQNSCDSPELTGTIQVSANAELTTVGPSSTLTQVTCVNTDISPINIRFENSLTPIINNLPSGLITQISGNILKITGRIAVGGVYQFDIESLNGTCTTPVVVPIRIDIQPNFSILEQFDAGYSDNLSTNIGGSRVKHIACEGDRTGEIKVEMSDVSYSYIYSWTGPNNYSNTTTSNHIKNLLPGTYTVHVSALGANQCSVSDTYVVRAPDPLQIVTNEVVPVSCDNNVDDGIISITAEGGNTDFYKQLTWYKFVEQTSCFTYTIKLRDMDNDGIYDIVDADIDNDGVTDTGKTDNNNDGIIDDADTNLDGAIDANFSLASISYQNCDSGQFTNLNLLVGDFTSNGTLTVCARPNSVSANANLDHDLDANTPMISSVAINGGVTSCSSGTWTEITSLSGISYASGLSKGLYKVEVQEIEFATGMEYCFIEKSFEITKNEITYGNIKVSSTYCEANSGYIDIDIMAPGEDLLFYYNGTRIAQTDVSIISTSFGVDTYRLAILNPQDNATLEIQDEFGCGVSVNSDLLSISINDPSFSFTSPEFEKYGTISERSSVLFSLIGVNSYDRLEWDFGDASPIEEGNRVSHQYQAEGTFTVTLTVYNASGCFKTTTQEIIVGRGYTLIMPNTFTPNNDNINDRIGPLFTGLKEVNFYVYTRSGVLLYEETVKEDSTTSIGPIKVVGWDGKNADPNSNYYTYKIIAVRLNDEIVMDAGTIFLLK